jgi:hypothetical protein
VDSGATGGLLTGAAGLSTSASSNLGGDLLSSVGSVGTGLTGGASTGTGASGNGGLTSILK